MPQLPEKNIIRKRYVIFNPKEKLACPLVIHNQDTGRVIMVHAIYITSIREKYFKKYSFDEDVMIALFRYCYDKQALHNNYIIAVAEGWASNNIKTMNDLEKYYMEFDQLSKIKKSVSRKLGLQRSLSQYEEAYIEKWTKDYNYTMDILEIALKKTTSKASFSFDYLDKIITDWHDRNLTTSQDINNYLKDQKQKAKFVKDFQTSTASGQISIQKYFDETKQYEDESKFYANL